METKYIEPTFESRVKIGLIACAGFAASVAMEIWWRPFTAYVRALPLCESLPWLRGMVVAFALFSLLVGGIAARACLLTLRSGQSPFPSAWVWSRTQVRTGWKAKLAGYIFGVLATACLAAPLVGLYYARVIFFEPCR